MIEKTFINDLLIINTKKIEDTRGFFSETFKQDIFNSNGLDISFVQDNHSLSKKKNTLRGLHFQLPPFEQAKLVRVVRGSIIDVAVDLRTNSKTFKKYFKINLSANNFKQLYIPVGFAHGFITLEDNTEVLYKTSNYYSKEHERGILWSDNDIAINWGNEKLVPILSDKDKSNFLLKNMKKLF